MNRERQQLKQTQDQLATANQQLAEVARDQEELAQLKKQTKEATAELHREQQSIELEKVSGQQQLIPLLQKYATIRLKGARMIV
jgi:2-oxo-4-hydroxy-4-carboxy--5-ureidoimidazoline (OHCU) decarboxylase